MPRQRRCCGYGAEHAVSGVKTYHHITCIQYMNTKQLHYLRSMDIDVWQRRGLVQPVNEVKATSEAQTALSEPIAVIGTTQSAAVNEVVTKHIDKERVTSSIQFDSSSLVNWSDVESAVSNCTRCALHGTRTQTVFGVGDRSARWMIIGEAPGAEEDRQGEPFVGRAGQLLNSMLLAIGLQREQVFIANILKCRPPNNRDPSPAEVSCCMPYLQRQIDLVNPRIIVCVGRIAAQNLLSTDTPIGKLRGSVHYLGEQRRPVVVTYHPAYLLRSPGEKRKAWNDLQFALQTFAAVSSVTSEVRT